METDNVWKYNNIEIFYNTIVGWKPGVDLSWIVVTVFLFKDK